MGTVPVPIPTYSFQDVNATLSGPGGVIGLGQGSAASEEGISIEMTEETDSMKIGADGSAMHSLHASRAGRAIVRLLKTSPVNALLDQLYRFQRTSSLFWGKNTIVVTNPVTGDNYTLTACAFVKSPNNTWDKEGPMLEWEFNVAVILPIIGSLGV